MAGRKKTRAKAERRDREQSASTHAPAAAAASGLSDAARAELVAALAGLDLEFCGPEDAREGGDELRERYAEDTWSMGTLWSQELWSACAEAVATLELLALCPARHLGEWAGVPVNPALYADAARPGTLWYAPNPEMPAALFVPVRADAASVRAVLDEYAGERPRVPIRAWMGFGSGLRIPDVYSGELVEVDDHELERFFVFSPVASSLSRRTYFSGSRFAWEVHAEDLYVWDLEYPPCATSEPVLTRFKEITGYADLPLDMPVDLVSAIHGFEFATSASLVARIARESDPRTIAAIFSVLAAIGWRELATAELLRRHLRDDLQLARRIASLAITYRWERLAWELGLAAGDAEFRAKLGEVLAGYELTASPRLGPCASGALRVLPAGADLADLHALAAARGWSRWDVASDAAPGWRAGYELPDARGRVAWVEVPALELVTLVVEGDEPALAGALSGESAAAWSTRLEAGSVRDRWHAAAALAWLDDPAHAPRLLEFLRARLAGDDWMERLVAARLIGVARAHAARGLLAAARAAERRPEVAAASDAVLAALA